MKSVAIAHEKFQRHPKSTRHHVRVRRGNLQDAEQLRQKLLDAALALFVSGDLKAVSMRAIAQRVGVSTMASYRDFSNQAELLSGLWQFKGRNVYAFSATSSPSYERLLNNCIGAPRILKFKSE